MSDVGLSQLRSMLEEYLATPTRPVYRRRLLARLAMLDAEQSARMRPNELLDSVIVG